jgi:hypothetical protein
MIRTVVREHKWSPAIVGDLFLDEKDFEGLVFWYKDILKVNKELEAKLPKK